MLRVIFISAALMLFISLAVCYIFSELDQFHTTVAYVLGLN